MEAFGTLAVAALCSTPVAADEFARSAKSGQMTLMRQYSNFNMLDCSPYPGKVNPVMRPTNGSLSTSQGPYVIGVNRFTGTQSKCAGRKTTALNVYYTSKPGFRGTDIFTVNAVYREGIWSVTDRFTVTVQ